MSDKRISISIDEYNMLHTEILSQKATIINLTAENNLLANDRDGYVQLLTDQNTSLTADNERLRAALLVCELELNAYYRRLYPGDHPYSQQELAQAMASNPATAALSGGKQ